jgi:two-component system sensor histidine kinase CreC
MSYSFRIFVSTAIILGLGFWGYGYWLLKEVRSQYSVTIEDSLVDFSNVLASYLSAQADQGQLNTKDFDKAFKNFKKLTFRVNIHGVIKGSSPINAYVTDADGVVVYDSRGKQNVGKDFSQWNDVYLTLKGEYGARSTRTNSSDPLSSVFYIAAPIQYEGNVIGVVSVIKPEQSLRAFVARGRKKVLMATALVLFLAMFAAALFSYWLTRPIWALTDYANRITKGEVLRPPRSTSVEFTKLAKAFDEMRISLEGKKSVERFVQHLTHELKSPLSAIAGAAELLRSPMPDEKKKQFISNIEKEAERAKNQLEELLELAALESRSELLDPQEIKLINLFANAKESVFSLLERKDLKVEFNVEPESLSVVTEIALMRKVFVSLLSNAIDFSPRGGVVTLSAQQVGGRIQIAVEDQGPGIPDYAREKVFEKFFSLERPATGKKSSGLGLSFVKEAVALHGGAVKIDSSELPGLGVKVLILLDS